MAHAHLFTIYTELVWYVTIYEQIWLICVKKRVVLACICSFLIYSNENSWKKMFLKIVSFTNQSDESTPSRTPVITLLFMYLSPAGKQGGPCCSLIVELAPLWPPPPPTLRQLEIAGPTLLLCSARWTPTGKLWASTAACHTEYAGQWYNSLWDILLTHQRSQRM